MRHHQPKAGPAERARDRSFLAGLHDVHVLTEFADAQRGHQVNFTLLGAHRFLDAASHVAATAAWILATSSADAGGRPPKREAAASREGLARAIRPMDRFLLERLHAGGDCPMIAWAFGNSSPDAAPDRSAPRAAPRRSRKTDQALPCSDRPDAQGGGKHPALRTCRRRPGAGDEEAASREFCGYSDRNCALPPMTWENSLRQFHVASRDGAIGEAKIERRFDEIAEFHVRPESNLMVTL